MMSQSTITTTPLDPRPETPVSSWRKLLVQSWMGALVAAVALWLLAGWVTGSLSLSFVLANATIA